MFFVHTKILHRPLEPATAFVALGVYVALILVDSTAESHYSFNRVKEGLTTLPNAVNSLLNTWVALGRLTSYLNQPEIEDTTWDTTSMTISCTAATIGWPTGGDPAQEGPTFLLRDVDLTLPSGQFTLVCGPLGCGKTLFVSLPHQGIVLTR